MRTLRAMKVIAIVSAAVLVLLSYGVRGVAVNLITFLSKATDVVETSDLEQFRAISSQRARVFDAETKKYDAAIAKFEERVVAYEQEAESETDPYQARSQQQMQQQIVGPRPPTPPFPRAVEDRIADLNQEFRSSKHSFFQTLPALHIAAALAALVLTASLIGLALFDVPQARIANVMLLAVCFIFLIGPALFSAYTGFILWLDPPAYELTQFRGMYR